jgi:hypothetical protein
MLSAVVVVGCGGTISAKACDVCTTTPGRGHLGWPSARVLCADFVAKAFEPEFLEPLMRFTRGDVRDHIASSKINHGSPQ